MATRFQSVPSALMPEAPKTRPAMPRRGTAGERRSRLEVRGFTSRVSEGRGPDLRVWRTGWPVCSVSVKRAQEPRDVAIIRAVLRRSLGVVLVATLVLTAVAVAATPK